MKNRNLRTYALSATLALGLLLTGCSGTNTASSSEGNEQATITEETASANETSSAIDVSSADYSEGAPDEDVEKSVVTDGISNPVINSHNVEEVTASDFGEAYVARDTVNVTYSAGDLTGILPQTVTKDFEFYYNKDTGAWEMLKDTTTACEVNNDALPGSSWKYESIDSDSLKSLFGDEISADDTGVLYLHFLKRVGPFAFNLSNEKNTSSERFFTTVGTNGTLSWVGADKTIEKNFSIANGSASDSGNIIMEVNVDNNLVNMNFGTDVVTVSEYEYDTALGLEVDESKVYTDSLPTFEVTTTSIADGEWKTEIGLKEKNLSPELTWDPVEGATKYAIIMIDDTTASNFLHWFTIVDSTHLDEGAFTDVSEGYAGPYPPEVHEYDVYVVALADDPGEVFFQVDTTGGDIAERMTSLNKKSDGSVGNVLAYGQVGYNFTPGSDYYGSR